MAVAKLAIPFGSGLLSSDIPLIPSNLAEAVLPKPPAVAPEIQQH